ncbi:Multicopper oxidase, type 2 [Sesbania bispinosa]|nr:Multicopper oxidase, type 2 [Sesbania bispinosa]
MERTLLLIKLVTILSTLISYSSGLDKLVDAPKLEMFVDELPHMPKILGYEVVHGIPRPTSLKIGMFKKTWKFHRDLPPTLVFAYGANVDSATVPGPTIEALFGIDTYVTWQNHLPPNHILPWDPTIPTAVPHTKMGVPTVVHLHGGIHESESDGNANSWFTFGFQETGPTWTKKTYHYSNNQHPGTLFYHDHTLGLTRVNLVAGLLGAYIIHHHLVEDPLGLPHGGEFDRPLIVIDRNFYINGSIYMNSTGNNPSIHPKWQPEYFGDVIIVNGKAWPHLTVKRCKYRFRIVNACNARFLSLFFTNGLRFTHVASDSAYLDKPIIANKTVMGPSEITNIIVDFSESTTDSAILANDAPYPYPSGNPVNEANNKVMKFIILPHQEVDRSQIPKKLLEYPSADLSNVSSTRYIAMYEYMSNTSQPTHLYLNGKPFEAPVTETPKEGSTELWYVINLTGDNHPLHIHLALFKVLDQTELMNLGEFKSCMMRIGDAVKCHMEKYARGKKVEVLAHEKGWKNVFKIMPGYVTKIAVRFSYIHTNAHYSFDATVEHGYLYHCHMLDHEDNEMMRPLKVIK